MAAIYVRIYCAEKALKDARHLVDHPESFGYCFARRRDAGWECCCCGKKVKVAA